MKKIITIAVTLTLVMVSTVFAGSSILGHGAVSCKEYQEVSLSGEDISGFYIWIQGYMTAVDILIENSKLQRNLDFSTPTHIARLMDNYCTLNPNKTVRHAAIKIYGSYPKIKE